MAALVMLGAAVLAPWPGSGPWVATSPVGLALLAAVAGLMVPVTVDLVAGRDRASAILLGPPLAIAAAVGTVLVGGGDLARVRASQGLGPEQAVTAVVVAVALVGCLVIGVVGAARRSRREGAAGAPALVMGVSVGVIAVALSTIVVVLGAPAPPTANVVTASGGAPTTPAASPAAAAAPASGNACPAEAAATLPEAAAGAPVIAHDARVHVAICQGASGGLYYYGADDRTHLTVTLPATRSEDSWIATNNGVTYFLTPDHLMITKGSATLADKPLANGWTR